MIHTLVTQWGIVPITLILSVFILIIITFIVGRIIKYKTNTMIRHLILPFSSAGVVIMGIAVITAYYLVGPIDVLSDAPRTQGVDRISDISIRANPAGETVYDITIGKKSDDIVATGIVESIDNSNKMSVNGFKLLDSVEYEIRQVERLNLFGPATPVDPEINIIRVIDGPTV